jgi:hypothetical protein
MTNENDPISIREGRDKASVRESVSRVVAWDYLLGKSD